MPVGAVCSVWVQDAEPWGGVEVLGVQSVGLQRCSGVEVQSNV